MITNSGGADPEGGDGARARIGKGGTAGRSGAECSLDCAKQHAQDGKRRAACLAADTRRTVARRASAPSARNRAPRRTGPHRLCHGCESRATHGTAGLAARITPPGRSSGHAASATPRPVVPSRSAARGPLYLRPLLPQPQGPRQLGSLGGIARRGHGVIDRQAPFRPVRLGRQPAQRQMPAESLVGLSVLEADECDQA